MRCSLWIPWLIAFFFLFLGLDARRDRKELEKIDKRLKGIITTLEGRDNEPKINS